MTAAPRQLSANGEHGFPIHPCCGRVRVFCDGDMLRNVIAYDADAGWVEVIAHDDCGQLMRREGFWVVTRYKGAIQADIT
jgi:hypothetical protein